MAVLWMFREPSLCRHVRRELLRNAWLDFAPNIPTTACHQSNYVETYSRFNGQPVNGDGFRGRAIGIGPQLRWDWSPGSSLVCKYQHEMSVRNRPQGERFWIE